MVEALVSRARPVTKEESVFPYVVPAAWIKLVGPASSVSWQLSEDVYIALVYDRGAVLTNVSPDDLAQMQLDESSAFNLAAQNTVQAWSEDRFDFATGRLSDGTRVGCAKGTFLAPAAGLLLEPFYELLARDFGCKNFIAVAVNQDCLFAFPHDEATLSSAALREAIDVSFANHPKPTSRSWLLLNGEWPRGYPGPRRF